MVRHTILSRASSAGKDWECLLVRSVKGFTGLVLGGLGSIFAWKAYIVFPSGVVVQRRLQEAVTSRKLSERN